MAPPSAPTFSATQELRQAPVQPTHTPTPAPTNMAPPSASTFSATQELRQAPVQPTQTSTPAPTNMPPPSAPTFFATQELRQPPAQPTQTSTPAPTNMPPPSASTFSATQELRQAPVQPTQTPTPAPATPAQSLAVPDGPDIPSFPLLSDQEIIKLVRKVCLRLHSVARQLRLRRDSRPTVEIEDDYDLQDLLRALLKMEFDEVGTDEWTPPYAGSLPRATLLLNREQIAIVAKKTRPGMTTKEIAEQVAADSAFYSARNKCTTLFCFVYDPEGRIGSPKRLETDLTSVSDRYNVEVLVAPK
jgi:hypothetical protein